MFIASNIRLKFASFWTQNFGVGVWNVQGLHAGSEFTGWTLLDGMKKINRSTWGYSENISENASTGQFLIQIQKYFRQIAFSISQP
jgi:hypothetical protein